MSNDPQAAKSTASDVRKPRPVWLQALIGLLMGLAALVVVALLIGFLLPSSYHVERSLVIAAPVESIHPLVNTVGQWSEWTNWNTTTYPQLKYSYEGPESGVGAISNWTDPENGGGRLEITQSDPTLGVAYTTSFEGFANPMQGRINYEPLDEGTLVTWVAEGDTGSNPINRYFGLLFDSMIGHDFEIGLARLKRLAEADTQPE